MLILSVEKDQITISRHESIRRI